MDRETIINKEISIDVEHINNFSLELENGTKKMKEKFHKNAIKERNEYVNKEIKKFLKYKTKIYSLIKHRVDEIFPKDKSEYYNFLMIKLNEEKNTIIFNNNDFSIGYKLDLYRLISEMDARDDISLSEVNAIIKKIINVFKISNVSLTSNDFNYSMFTEKYMSLFLQNIDNNKFDEVMRDTFDSIYWECPNFTKHLKINFWFLMDKYKNSLNTYVSSEASRLLEKFNVTYDELLNKYLTDIRDYDVKISRDEFYNLDMFLTKKKNILDYVLDSATRSKNFDRFVIDGSFKDIADSNRYFDNIIELADTLKSLKLFYRYQFVIDDLKDKYNKKDANKNLYEQKLKEIKGEEAKKSKIYNTYVKSTGKNLFHKVDPEKIKSTKLEINDSIMKLYTLYEELHDLEIVDLISKKVTNVYSIYDLFYLSFNSYFYLEKIFKEHFKDQDDFSLEKELDNYFNFIYSPYVDFLKKINAFVDTSVSLVISDKYKLLGVNIIDDDITSDSLDSYMDTINYVKMVYDILNSKLSIENIYTIVKFMEFEPVDVDNNEEVI